MSELNTTIKSQETNVVAANTNTTKEERKMTQKEIKAAQKAAEAKAAEEMRARHGAIAKAYAEANPEPDQAHCPILVQRYSRKDGTHYHNSLTGEVTVKDGDHWSICYYAGTKNGSYFDTAEQAMAYANYCSTVYVPCSYGYEGVYVKYIPEYEMLEISNIMTNGKRGQEGTPRVWRYADYIARSCNATPNSRLRLFWFLNDPKVYGKDGEVLFNYATTNGKYTHEVEKFINGLCKFKDSCGLGIEFEKFIKVDTAKAVNDSNYRFYISCDYKYCYSWGGFYHKHYSTKANTVSKKSLTLNELINVQLTPVSELQKRYPFVTSRERSLYSGDYYNKATASAYAHFELVNENWSVIRFLRYDNYFGYGYNAVDSGEFRECSRFYIDKNGKIITAELFNGKPQLAVIPASRYQGYGSSSSSKFGNPEDLDKWEPLRYIKGVIKGTESSKQISSVLALLRHPILEQLYKAGYKNIYELVLRNGTISANIAKIFGVKEKTKTSINDLGSKTLLTAYNTYITGHNDRCNSYQYRMISNAKELTNNEVDNWDSEKIAKLFASLEFIGSIGIRSWKHDLNPEYAYHYYYRYEDNVEVSEDLRKRVLKLLLKGNQDAICLYHDFAQTYSRLTDGRKAGLPLEGLYHDMRYENIMRYHDNAIRLYNEQNMELERNSQLAEQERREAIKKKFEKLQLERRDKYNYSTDASQYLIKIPEQLEEITAEGVTLGHCVGSYKDLHAEGATNIIFLREKNNPDTPFYTIEVSNSHVVQIHGKFNKWLGNNPEAIPFVIEWLKKNHIKCDKDILLCKSLGYNKTREFLNAKDYGLEHGLTW